MSSGEVRGYSFYCPACKTLHSFNTYGDSPLWWFDGNLEKPSFSPSLRMLPSGCHLYVTGGQIIYCNDCPHEFKNKTIDMVDWNFGTSKPMTGARNMTDKPKPKQKHHEDCGDVGETGDHGDLGSNAADHPDRQGGGKSKFQSRKEKDEDD